MKKKYKKKKYISKKIANLINVKSIVTLLVTIVFCINSIRGVEITESFMNIFLIIISFYFGTQIQKLEDKLNNKESDVE